MWKVSPNFFSIKRINGAETNKQKYFYKLGHAFNTYMKKNCLFVFKWSANGMAFKK